MLNRWRRRRLRSEPPLWGQHPAIFSFIKQRQCFIAQKSANVFVFGNSRTVWSFLEDKLSYFNFIFIFTEHVVKSSNSFPDSDAHNSTLLDLFFTFYYYPRSQQLRILLSPEFSLNFYCFDALFPWVQKEEVYISFWLLEGFLMKIEIFEPEFLKRKTKFSLTTKCHKTEYDQIWPNYEQNIVILWYSINKLKRSVNMFPEFSLSALIFKEIFLSFPCFPWFFNFSRYFPDFLGFPWVLWTLIISCSSLAFAILGNSH